MVGEYLKRNLWLPWWSSARYRIFNPLLIFSLMAQHVTFSCSPLSVNLVELTKASRSLRPRNSSPSRMSDLVTIDCIQTAADLNISIDRKGENWFKFLIHPRRVAEYIKQYHCVGNTFFIITAAQFLILFYLCFKAMFHKIVTGTDEKLAQYYADSYFPRIHQSYPDAYDLDTFVVEICLYILVCRILRLYTLIRNSIINRNGYKHISIAQLNFSLGAAYQIPLYKWKTLLDIAFSHKRECSEDLSVRRAHIAFPKDLDKIIDNNHLYEILYFHNPINFDNCYAALKMDFKGVTKFKWTENWYVSSPCMRIDPIEFSWLISAGSVGIPISLLILTVLTLFMTTHELCTIASDKNENSCLAQIPILLFDLSRFARLFDILAMTFIQLPQQVEAGLLYWDCCIMISRARKVKEALQEDLDYCTTVSKIGYIYRSPYRRFKISPKDKYGLNRSIHLHIRLTQYIYHEFLDLRTAHAAFLNILLVGGGLLIAISASELLTTESIIKQLVLRAFMISASIPICLSLFFCIFAEYTVSI